MSAATTSIDAKRCIQRLRRRLAHWELAHLRTLAADLHERLEVTELRASDAEVRADFAEDWGDNWQDLALQLQKDMPGTSIGITTTGELVVLPVAQGATP